MYVHTYVRSKGMVKTLAAVEETGVVGLVGSCMRPTSSIHIDTLDMKDRTRLTGSCPETVKPPSERDQYLAITPEPTYSLKLDSFLGILLAKYSTPSATDHQPGDRIK